ncbi:MAG: UDP-glucose 4-epimerase [Thermoplasmata archaeon HGW-Thermoplasmata-1]|nr:MAG: UDP-glucose 4-epimerase [Thermoplasmata archaeon HGW-Thermoplasmata-1]
MACETRKILVTGALGQIGSELTIALRKKYGNENVVISDMRSKVTDELLAGHFEVADVCNQSVLRKVVREHDIDTVYHLAAILSATGERDPHLCWRVNMEGLRNTLEVARDEELYRVFCPSSIAAFGPDTPRDDTPQETVLRPSTMYGVTKVCGELLGDYYFSKFGVDIRGVRYPGIISYKTPPGGGTTDYAVAIYYEAIKSRRYECFVSKDTVLPMMYMPDAIKATLDLMEAPLESLKHHSDFNLAAMSFSAGELAAEIKKHVPEFEVVYKPDFRQKIADSWPRSIDDSAARNEWGWKPEYDLATMTKDMLEKLKERHEAGEL